MDNRLICPECESNDVGQSVVDNEHRHECQNCHHTWSSNQFDSEYPEVEVQLTGEWVFNHGTHRGTITSCDIAQPMRFTTKKEALIYYQERREFYHSIGYQFWYAKLTSPDGKTSTLESNSNYY